MQQQPKTQAENLFPSSPDDAETARRAAVLLPLPVEKTYDYLVPADMTLKAGEIVQVSFGPRKVFGVVWKDDTEGEDVPIHKLKPVTETLKDAPVLTANMMRFLDWVAQYTLSPAGLVLKMALSVPEAFIPEKSEIYYKLSADAPIGKLSAARQRVLEIVQQDGIYAAAKLAEQAGCGASVIRGMAEKNMLETVACAPDAPCMSPVYTGVDLSPEQQKAAIAIKDICAGNSHSVVLLDGVTGAGKTEVYFEALAQILEQDDTAQVLVLLPEIALSNQFIDRFRSRFGQDPALWHSSVGKAQRRKIWRGVAEGKTRVVVGARSALFLPFQNLALMILDEEHDASYKQEDGGPIYHARDMAVVRGKIENCPVILVSATPSLETMVNVQQKKYAVVELAGRFGAASLPDVHMIDMRQNPPPERASFLSQPLRTALLENLAAEEQSLLFLNRRGYAPLTLCRTCGHRLGCPSCTAWLVKHRKFDRLQCHHCGYSMPLPKKCPECEDEDSFAFCGPGVERIEEEVKRLMPDARTLLLSSDVLTSEAALATGLDKIHAHEVDVVIGTQLVAKGHHFPLLTLVGVVDADLGLEGGDLRAAERTYQLLHQVAGRAGRAEKPGHVHLQSYQPENPVMLALMEGTRDAFFAAEIDMRERSKMPPFGRLAGLVIAGKSEAMLESFCRDLARAAPRYEDVFVLGPAPAPIAIIRGQHRRRFLVKAPRNTNLQKLMTDWLSRVKIPSALRLKVDIDPYSFF